MRIGDHSSVVKTEPLAKSKYPESSDGMAFALRSMEADIATSRSTDSESRDPEAKG